jgi:hypothetical protein
MEIADGIHGIFIMFVPPGALYLRYFCYLCWMLDCQMINHRRIHEIARFKKMQQAMLINRGALEDSPQTLSAGEKIITGPDNTKT